MASTLSINLTDRHEAAIDVLLVDVNEKITRDNNIVDAENAARAASDPPLPPLSVTPLFTRDGYVRAMVADLLGDYVRQVLKRETANVPKRLEVLSDVARQEVIDLITTKERL